MHMIRPPSYSSRQCLSNHVHDDLGRLGQHLASGQGHLMTEVGNVPYQLMRLDETDALVPRPRF